MTKEELKEKAEEWIKDNSGFVYKLIDYSYGDMQDAFLAGCETMEAYNEKLLNGDIEKHNKIVVLEKACHKWFKRWREAKKDALYFDSSLQKQIEATYKVVEELNEAKEIISKFLNAKSIEETCVAESEAEKFLKEEENA